MWDHPTLRLNRAAVTRFQPLGDMAQRPPSLVVHPGICLNDGRLPARAALKDGALPRGANVVLKCLGRHSLDARLHDRIHRLATANSSAEPHARKWLLAAMEREVRLAR